MIKIWRFEFFRDTNPFPYKFEYLKGICRCHIITFGRWGVTYLGNECYNTPIENKL